MIRMKSAIGVLISLAVLCGPVVAQMPDPYIRDTVPVRGLMPYADQISSPIDNIDPVSGKLNLSIPLASIPAGRGGLGFDLALTYDSHLYDQYPYQVQGSIPPNNQIVTAIWNRLGPSQTGGGWSYNFQNIRLWFEERANFDMDDPNHPNYCSYDKVVAWRLRVGLSDGSAHILHLRPPSGENESYGWSNDGFAGVMPSGDVRPGCNDYYGWEPITGTMTYYTNDGSYLKYESGRLYFPDGRRIDVGYGGASAIYDANGNKISIQNLTSASGFSCPCTRLADDTADDTRGWIMIEYNVESEENTVTGTLMTRDRITAPGPNGNMVWTVDWEQVGSNLTYHEGVAASGTWPPDISYAVPGLAVRYVQMPLAAPIALSEIVAHASAPEQHRDPVPVYNSYKFANSDYFDIGAGELDYIRMPSGSEYFYTYRFQGSPLGWIPYSDQLANRNGLMKREMAFNDGVDGNDNHSCPELPSDQRIDPQYLPVFGFYSPCDSNNTDSLTWNYAYDETYGFSVVTNPDGGKTKYYSPGILGNLGEPLVYRIEELKSDGNLNGVVRKRTWNGNFIFYHSGGSGFLPMQNPYVTKETVSVGNASGTPTKSAVTSYAYDMNGNLRTKTEYDWVTYVPPPGIESGATIKRQMSLDYYVAAPTGIGDPNGYWQPHNPEHWAVLSARRLNAVKRQRVHVGNTNYAATEYVYDNAYTKGNVLYEKRWDSLKASNLPALGQLSTSNAQVLHRTYDTYGNLTDIYEPEVRTHITYNTNKDRVTQVDLGYPPAERSTGYAWNADQTALLSKTDLDNNLPTYYDYDHAGRRTAIDEAGMRKTETIYDDINRKVMVKGDLKEYGDGKLQSITHYDQLGRVKLVQKSDGTPLLGETDGIMATTRQEYFAGGRRVVASTPYRDLTDPTLEWTCTESDLLGRVTKVGMFKGGAAPADCGSTTNRTGLTTTQYDTEWTTVTDPAGKVRRQKRDALGRMIEVVEDPGGLNYSTTYTYDSLDNLTQVVQGAQTRTFKYSSLGRLIGSHNPETGIIAGTEGNPESVHYQYYDSGDLHIKTDARNITTTMVYDELHRIRTKTYNDSTPDVEYQYHLAASSASPNIGQLKSVTSSAAATEYLSYSALGQITCTRDAISGFEGYPTFNYDWYLNGAVRSIYYPSGRRVSYDVDDAGRTTKASAPGKTYMDLMEYAPDGRLTQSKLGNNIWETRDYRAPGTPTTYSFGTSAGAGNVMELEYNYSGTGNNGNLLSQTMIRPGGAWQQTFAYDGVNRLATAMETGGWNRTYGYDRYGNRWVAVSNNLAYSDPLEPQSQNEFDESTNRMIKTGVDYDFAGNQKDYDGFDLEYDAENRNTGVSGNGASGMYAYDGNGRRVKKVWTPAGQASQTTFYVYDALGRLAAEYSSEAPSGTGAVYSLSDMLGSVRATALESGQVTECYDYLPFGRMLSASDNGRGPLGCFPAYPATHVNSAISQKFTSKERDAETGLDYFLARYYSGAQGRFLSPDEFKGGPDDALTGADIIPLGPLPYADIGNPQSLNKYTYVLNNPLRYVDPDGHTWAEFFEGVGDTTYRPIVQTVSHPIDAISNIASAVAHPIDTISAIGNSVVETGKGALSGDSKALGEVTGTVVSALVTAGAAKGIAALAKGSEVAEVGSGIAKSFNPFKGKSAQEVGAMFEKKGFEARGPNPIAGKGGYVNPETGRSYHIDPGGAYKKGSEAPHVDVNRPKSSNLPKRKFPLEDKP